MKDCSSGEQLDASLCALVTPSQARAALSGGTKGKLMCGPLTSAIPHHAIAQPGSAASALRNSCSAAKWPKEYVQISPRSNAFWATADLVVILREWFPRWFRTSFESVET